MCPPEGEQRVEQPIHTTESGATCLRQDLGVLQEAKGALWLFVIRSTRQQSIRVKDRVQGKNVPGSLTQSVICAYDDYVATSGETSAIVTGAGAVIETA